MAATEPRMTLDAASLKALAHPLRVSLFRALSEGPATSAQLAQRMGSNTGTVSWHLRQLAKFGFIEDAPDHGNARERWWRARVAGTTMDIRHGGIIEDPVTLEAARWYARDSLRSLWTRLQHWIDTAEGWSEEWMGASVLHERTVTLTPEQLQALRQELFEVVDRHLRDAAPGTADARRVQLALQAFPTGEPHG